MTAGWLKTLVPYLDHYRRSEYRQALAIAHEGVGMAAAWDHLCLAAACAKLGRLDEARNTVDELIRLRPDVPECMSRYRLLLADHIVDGLRKAGLDIPDEPAAVD